MPNPGTKGFSLPSGLGQSISKEILNSKNTMFSKPFFNLSYKYYIFEIIKI